MGLKRILLLLFLFVLLAVVIFIFFKSSGEERIRPSRVEIADESGGTDFDTGEALEITLFFLSEEDTYLHPEGRKIASGTSLVEQARRTIEELLIGSRTGYLSPFPPDTKLREFYVTEDGVAYVDFSKELLEQQLPGSSAEIATVYSVVNTLAYNFESVKKVFILIDGKEQETLGGHINLSRPFLPVYDLIRK